LKVDIKYSNHWAIQLLNDISDGVILLDADLSILYINTAANNTIGNTEECNYLGKILTEVFVFKNEQSEPSLSFYFERLEHGKAILNKRGILKGADNQDIPIELSITKNSTKDLGEWHIKIVFKKLLNNSTHTEALSYGLVASKHLKFNSSQPFYDLAEKSPDIIYIIDVQKRVVVYFNRSELFGYDSKQLETSEGWIDIIHPQDIQKVQAHWNKFIKTGQNQEEIEYRIKKKNETYEWVLNRHSVLEKSNDGLQPKYVLLNITIITDRKFKEQKQDSKLNNLNALLEYTNELIWLVDSNYTFLFLNAATKIFFKNSFNTIISSGDHLLDVLPDMIKIEWIQWHKKALQGQKFSAETQIYTNDKIQHFELEFTPILSVNDEIASVSVYAKNIDTRKKNENDIIKANFELDSFVYRASHDLKAPLRSVLGLIQVIKNENNEAQRHHYLNLINKSINKLDAFISDLTNFSRNSRLEIKKQNINFQEIINECTENLQYMEYAAKVKVFTTINLTEPCVSDAVRLSIVFQNLLSNAIKYANPRNVESWVKLNVSNKGLYCLISIEDNGVGIKEQYMNQIFNMFFRATNDSFGSGLGLYITKQVIEKMGGEISLSSTYGQGTLFNIKIPINSGEISLNF
jgi:PAS domain S-box-containing protein